MKTKPLFISLTLSLGLTLALLGLLSGGAWAATIVVTSTADSGPGTLRQALLDAGNGDTITFDTAVFPPTSPVTIALTSALPDITQGNLTIDASNAGVIIDGSGVSEGDGLRITSDGNTIKGLQIIRFPEDGVEITDGAKHNTIGGDWTMGSAPHGEGNVITLNKSHGVNINDTGTMSTVSGNLIGLDLDGTVDLHPQALAISPGYAADATIFVGTEEDGVFKSTDGGGSWVAVNTGLVLSNVQALAISPDYVTDQIIFAGTAGGGVFKSSDSGGNWAAVNTSLDEVNVRAFAISPNYGTDHTLFAGTDNGIFKSADGGNNWTAVSNGLTNLNISALAISPDYATDQTVFAGTRGGGVFKSTDMGLNWAEVNNDLTDLQVIALATSPNYTADQTIFAGTERDGVFKSTDGGGSWVSADLTDVGQIVALAFSPDYATDQTIFVGTYAEGYGVCKSTDGGSTWTQGNNGLANTDYIGAFALSPNYPIDQTLFVSAFWDGVFKSVDGGSHWTSANNGLTEMGNYGQGVSISGGAQWNTIGGDTPGERNVISNNSGYGIWIGGAGTDHNTVIGNYIGTDATGSTNLGNAGGVSIDYGAQQNVIGGTRAGERNVISGNNWGGVGISGSGTMNNVVIGNFIGTDATGSAAVGNNGTGVGISNWGGGGAQQNRIGGTTEEERNIISGNNGNGVQINGPDSDHNVVTGNYIGTNISGTAAIGNTGKGVSIGEGAQYNVIGGDTAGERNLLSGNGHDGVSIYDSGTMSNTVSGNYIGTNIFGAAAIGNAGNGVRIQDRPQYNVIGGDTAGERNLLSGNGHNGVSIHGIGTMSNTVSGNYIGTNISVTAAISNAWNGVRIFEGARYNVIGGDTAGERNLISGNNWNGVTIRGSGTIRNTLTQNSIHRNMGKGIGLADGGNLELPAPVITNTDLGAGTAAGTACASCTIEIFSDTADEGQVYEGTTTADANGDWSFTKGSSLTGPNITATATDPQGNTSEFSAVPYRLYLPLVLKGYCSCGPDNYEPNDSFAQAYGPLTSGQTYQSYISCCDVVSRRDYFYLEISTTNPIGVDLTNIPAGVDYDLYLYNSAQYEVGRSQNDDNTPEHISHTPAGPGRYYILVFSPYAHYSASPYSLRGTYD